MQLIELAAKVQALGLNDKEAKVYVATLFIGPAAVMKIAEQADVKRATAYVILEQLAEMGLVSESTEANKTVYLAEDPEALKRWLDRQKQVVAERQEALADLSSELLSVRRTEDKDAPVVRFYRGAEGIASVFAESVRKSKFKDVVYGFTDQDEAKKIMPNHAKKSPAARLKKKISSKVLYWSTQEELSPSVKLLREVKKLKEPPLADISLYTDRASLVSYHGQDAVAIVIESKEIVGALRQLFELAWGNKGK